MAYSCVYGDTAQSGMEVIPYFSNPYVKYNNKKTGSTSDENNAKVIRDNMVRSRKAQEDTKPPNRSIVYCVYNNSRPTIEQQRWLRL